MRIGRSRTAAGPPDHPEQGGPAQPEVTGSVDTLVEGATLRRGKIVVEGWHASGGRPVVAVAASVQGAVVGAASTGIERPDVAAALGDDAARSGWSMELDLTDVSADRATVVFHAWPSPGSAPVVLPPVHVRFADPSSGRAGGNWAEDRGPRTGIDLPPGGELPRSWVDVTGFAYWPGRIIDRVELLVDGEHVGRCRLGLARDDDVDRHGSIEAQLSGLTTEVDLGALDDDRPSVELALRVRPIGGEPRDTGHATFTLAPTGTTFDDDVREGDPDRADELSRVLGRLPAGTGPADGQLRLLVATHDLDYGGAQLWLQELLRRTGAGTRFPCTLVAQEDGPLRDELERLGIVVHVVGRPPAGDLDAYQSQVTEISLWAAAAGANAALVNSLIAYAGSDAAVGLGLPVVWAIHESWTPDHFWTAQYGRSGMHPGVRARAMRALAGAGAVVFESAATLALHRDDCGPGRAAVVPYGVDTEAIGRFREDHDRTAVRRDLGFGEDDRVLLVLGTIDPRKAQTVITECFGLLCDDRPAWTLVLVGDTGTGYSERLAATIAERGLGDRVRVEPVTEAIFPWYLAADVFVCASDVESLPRSVLEAMAFGVPVLATSVFGLPEVIDEGRTGFLVEPLSRAALIDGLRRVLDLDPDRLAAVGEAGRTLVAADYGADGYSADVRTLLDGLVADPSALPADLVTPRHRGT